MFHVKLYLDTINIIYIKKNFKKEHQINFFVVFFEFQPIIIYNHVVFFFINFHYAFIRLRCRSLMYFAFHERNDDFMNEEVFASSCCIQSSLDFIVFSMFLFCNIHNSLRRDVFCLND
mgnify:CR=1 FL=1